MRTVNKVEAAVVLDQLVTMTRAIGDPVHDYVILGEGNTSARVDEDTFWVKASGVCMADADARAFLRVRLHDVLAILDALPLSEHEVRARLAAAKADPDAPGSPSIETAMHALCLSLGNATFVGHTHPTALNGILCAQGAEAAFAGYIFPAEALVCGEPLFVPYAPPGQPLAQAVHEGLLTYNDRYGQPPRVILLQNHGLVALGPTPQAVLDVTAMMVRAARILLGTYALGGPHFIEPSRGLAGTTN